MPGTCSVSHFELSFLTLCAHPTAPSAWYLNRISRSLEIKHKGIQASNSRSTVPTAGKVGFVDLEHVIFPSLSDRFLRCGAPLHSIMP